MNTELRIWYTIYRNDSRHYLSPHTNAILNDLQGGNVNFSIEQVCKSF